MRRSVPTAMVGGSFDPVHLGHLHLVHTVVHATEYRRFILVPLKQNHFKPDSRPAPDAHRLAMLTLAIAAYPALYPTDPPIELLIDECELNRTGISYTYDTAKHLSEAYPIAGKLAVLIGDDLLADLHKWHAYEELKALVRFVVIRREAESQQVGDSEADLIYLQNEVLRDNSTAIRNMLATLQRGEPMPEALRRLMPEEVARYLDAHQLYRL